MGLRALMCSDTHRIWDDARDTTICPTRNAAISHNASAKNDAARSADDVARSTDDVTWSENGATRNVPCKCRHLSKILQQYES